MSARRVRRCDRLRLTQLPGCPRVARQTSAKNRSDTLISDTAPATPADAQRGPGRTAVAAPAQTAPPTGRRPSRRGAAWSESVVGWVIGSGLAETGGGGGALRGG